MVVLVVVEMRGRVLDLHFFPPAALGYTFIILIYSQETCDPNKNTPYQYILVKTHPYTLPYQRTPSTHPTTITCQHTPCQHTLPPCPLNPASQPTLSTRRKIPIPLFHWTQMFHVQNKNRSTLNEKI